MSGVSAVRAIVPVLALAGCASGISQRVMDPLLPALSGEFTAPLSVVAWVITGFSLGYAISQLGFGPVGDLYGKLRVVTLVCFANAVAAVLCALAPGLATLTAARVLAGAMCAGVIPLAMAWIGDAVPYADRQPVIARFAVGQILGVSLGQLIGGLAADHLGRALPFWLVAAMFGTSAVVLSRQGGLQRMAHDAGTTPATLSPRHLLREFGHVLQVPWARVVLLCVFLEGALGLGAFAFFATHLHDTLGVSLTLAGSASMLFGIGGLFYSLTARQWVGRWGEAGLVRRGAVGLVITMGVVALAPQVWAVGLACLAMGVSFYFLHSTLQTNATQMAPARRGVAVAAFAQCYFLGQAAGVWAVGLLIGAWDSSWVIAGCGVGAALVALHFARQRQRLADTAQA
jgi:predicted MFS family arabinose efflux permease